jgi:hypothetical protein
MPEFRTIARADANAKANAKADTCLTDLADAGLPVPPDLSTADSDPVLRRMIQPEPFPDRFRAAPTQSD